MFRAACRLILLSAVAAILAGAGAQAADAPQTDKRLPAASAWEAATCQRDAARKARAEQGLRSIAWTETSRPAIEQPGGRRNGPAVTGIAVTGRARAASGWVAITAHCAYARGQRKEVALEIGPPLDSSFDLDLSRVVPQPLAPRQQDSHVPPPSLPETAAPPAPPAAGIRPTLREISPELPATPRRQDFLHDHQFGIQLDAPF